VIIVVTGNDERTAGRMHRHVVDALFLAGDLDRDLRLRLHVDPELADDAVDLEVLRIEAAPRPADPAIVAGGGRQDEERGYEGASQNGFPLTGHDQMPSSGRCVPRLHGTDMSFTLVLYRLVELHGCHVNMAWLGVENR